MGYLGDGLLGLNFGRFERIDPKYFGSFRVLLYANWMGFEISGDTVSTTSIFVFYMRQCMIFIVNTIY